jgi:radical SAM superfamily enzyme YgiQ (UPF0313 family)
MREAGINVLAIGFESPIPDELQAMSKQLRPDDMLELVRLYHRAGFRIHGMFIFGYPVQPGVEFRMGLADRVRHFRRFIRRGKLETVQVLLPIPLPGTELTRRLVAEDRIFPTDCVGLEYYDGNFPLIQPDAPLTPEDMQSAARRIMGRFYRLRCLFNVGLNILLFPSILLRLNRIGQAWCDWRRRWLRDLYRTGGWLLLRRWTSAFRKAGLTRKSVPAKRALNWFTRRPDAS